MQYLAVQGSPNPNGYGSLLFHKMQQMLIEEKSDITFEILKMSDAKYSLCKGCSKCFIEGNCELTKTDNYDFFDLLLKHKGYVFFVPSYIHQMPAGLKNCFDRMAGKMHEFPLAGKKAVIISYSMSNGEKELSDYVKGIFLSLGCEVVQSFAFNRCRDNEAEQLVKIKEAVLIMNEKIRERKYAVTKTQEQLFTYIKQIVNMERENHIKSYKQIRWSELMQYASLSDFLRHAEFE